jgi:hypothetical protein
MNDLEILNDVFAPAPPSDAAHRDARAALLTRARPRRRRAPLRIAAVMTAAAVVAAFILVVQSLGDGPVAAAEVFERAAHAAETKDFVAPRPDQWIYIEDRITTSDGSAPFTRRIWHRVDSGGVAWADAIGRVHVREFTAAERPPAGIGPVVSDDELTQLPTDPDALLRWAHERVAEDSDVYAVLGNVLAANVLPPDLEAGIFRAMEQLPGVTVSVVDVLGQRVLSLEQTEGALRMELFLDPETYAYRGNRATLGQDTTTSIRTETAILDALPG